VWICLAGERRDSWCQKLGLVPEVAEKLSQWLAGYDAGERLS